MGRRLGLHHLENSVECWTGGARAAAWAKPLQLLDWKTLAHWIQPQHVLMQSRAFSQAEYRYPHNNILSQSLFEAKAPKNKSRQQSLQTGIMQRPVICSKWSPDLVSSLGFIAHKVKGLESGLATNPLSFPLSSINPGKWEDLRGTREDIDLLESHPVEWDSTGWKEGHPAQLNTLPWTLPGPLPWFRGRPLGAQRALVGALNPSCPICHYLPIWTACSTHLIHYGPMKTECSAHRVHYLPIWLNVSLTWSIIYA
jgi:hypothetical protein